MNIPAQYKLIKSEYIEEIAGNAYLLKHIKSGARVLLVENDDNNKVFGIAFRTPVSDSTGVPHIMEHSVLCGSKKYPVKDPFMFLAKSSVNTFLNAMTFPDKTLYPVASCNDKDFQNLMGIYMDAVFYPKSIENDMSFKQEGWHYELKDKDAPLTINGVVYSEMKGVFSDPDSTLDRHCINSLYPDTTYAFESGGDPEDIPDLTFEQYKAFHDSYYHPSNSYIYLYGDMNFEEKLAWIDAEYLKDFDEIELDSRIELQKPFETPACLEIPYPINEGEETEGKTQISVQWSIGDILDSRLYYACQILEYVLVGAEGAPLREALIKSGLGEDTDGGYESDLLQPFFSITLRNTDVSSKDAFIKIIDDTLQEIADKGINKKSLLAAINNMEFRVREADFGGYPKGLVYCMEALETWLYNDETPVSHLKYNDIFKYLKEQIDNGYFEDIIRKYFINNPHKSIVSLIPVPGLDRQKEAEFAEKLAAKKASLSDNELEQIISDTAALAAYQDTVPTLEELATLPHLELSDIDKACTTHEVNDKSLGDIPVLSCNVNTSGITYFKLEYGVKDFSKEEIQLLPLLRDFMGAMNTKEHHYSEITDEVNLNMGNLDMAFSSYVNLNNNNSYPSFVISASCLHDKQKDAVKVLREIVFDTIYDDEERMAELIKQTRSRMEQRCQGQAHNLATCRVLSYTNAQDYYSDLTIGIEYLRFIRELTDKLDETPDYISIFQEQIKNLANRIFDTGRLAIHVVDEADGEAGILDALQEYFLAFEPGCGCGTYRAWAENLDQYEELSRPADAPVNEGFKTTSTVNYAAIGGFYDIDKFPFNGAMHVAAGILRNEYLWNEIRVHGGAYGAICTIGKRGGIAFVSYRDPNVKNTYDVYKSVPDFIKNFDVDKRTMQDFIISQFGVFDKPQPPRLKGHTAIFNYISGNTPSRRQKSRDEVYNCTPADIRALAPCFESVITQNNICTIGSATTIERDNELFDTIENLL